MRGEGEAQAKSTLAKAMNQDPELFAFLRSLTAYKKILAENATVVLPGDKETGNRTPPYIGRRRAIQAAPQIGASVAASVELT